MNENRKTKKRLLITVIGALFAVLIVIVVAIVVNNRNNISPTADEYFVSDDSKMVLITEINEAGLIEGLMESGKTYEESLPAVPELTYTVYKYSGDTITGVNVYYKYDSHEAAEAAKKLLELLPNDFADEMIVKDEFVIYTLRAEQYAEASASAIRESIDDLKGAGIALPEINEQK